MRVRTRLAVLLLGAALVQAGCLTTSSRQDAYKEGNVEVFLRTDKRLTSVVEKGYDHPLTIAPVRVAHILSRLDVRKSVEEGNQRLPAIPTEVLYSVAEGVSRALSRAGPDQEVVVMAVRTERTLRILDQDYLTSFLAYVRGDRMFVHLSRCDWRVPDRRRNKELPQPRLDETPSRLRIYPGTAMAVVDTNTVAIDWRDPIFQRPTRTKILPTGEVKRKTILLESPADPDDPGTAELEPREPLPEGLSPAQLRALADLEEERLAGRITEAEYRLRAREIMDR